ncbi:hypothetical protein [Pseudomonas phage vB_Pae-PA152]|uniref:Uncharacterized protein n=2 Tax=Luzseptimavirus KPP21 TaxID=1982595 RepID=A0A7S6B6B7_9CAUD|nr:hypothetical protein AMP2_gp056 [Pseudomonas phage vB_Pae_AM.P2]QWY17744.1 hypothetical protein [Pseudomonas phage vB_Pae-PA152]
MVERKRSLMCNVAYNALLSCKYGKESLWIQKNKVLKRHKELDDELKAKVLGDGEWLTLWGHAMDKDVTR